MPCVSRDTVQVAVGRTGDAPPLQSLCYGRCGKHVRRHPRPSESARHSFRDRRWTAPSRCGGDGPMPVALELKVSSFGIPWLSSAVDRRRMRYYRSASLSDPWACQSWSPLARSAVGSKNPITSPTTTSTARIPECLKRSRRFRSPRCGRRIRSRGPSVFQRRAALRFGVGRGHVLRRPDS